MVDLKVGQVLSSANEVNSNIYFPVSGAIALYVGRSHTDAAHGLAVGLVGAEGAVGLQAALGFNAGNMQLLVQSPGRAYRIEGVLAQRLVQRRRTMLLEFSRYLWTLYENIAALAAKPFTHEIKARLAHWLLLSEKQCAPEPLELTHAQIALMLGVRRASISIAARQLKLKRYISYSRGRIALLNLPALEALANA